MILDMLMNIQLVKAKKIDKNVKFISTIAPFVLDTLITFSSLTVVITTFAAYVLVGRPRKPRRMKTIKLCAAIVTQTLSN